MDAADDHTKTISWSGWKDARIPNGEQQQRHFGLELQCPFAQHILDGRKTIETRAYALPPDLLSDDDGCHEVKVEILESAKGEAGVSSMPNVVPLVNNESPLLRQKGWCTFTKSFRYTSREQFDADLDKHMVDSSSGYGWSEERPMYGWVVGSYGVYASESNANNGYSIAERRMRSLFELLPRPTPTILITGASGMLGRALHRLLLQKASSASYNVIGAGYTRLEVDHYPAYFTPSNSGDSALKQTSSPVKLHRLDLLDLDATSEFLQKQCPDIIVHCAAERYPDAFEAKLEESMKLNIESTKHLARECQNLARMAAEKNDGRGNHSAGPYLIYISTSYVFDGGVTSKVFPPYKPQSKTNPINNYGRSKWEGECAVRDILNNQPESSTTTNANDEGEGTGGRGIIVRVPILYGEDCSDLSESTALEMMKLFTPSTQLATTQIKRKSIDHWALRFPTSVEDVACVLKLMIDRLVQNKFTAVAHSSSDTYHIASPHGTTKYELMQLQAKLLNIPTSDVDERAAGNSAGPPKNSAPRPQCTQLDCTETWKALGCDASEEADRGSYEFATLEDGMKRALHGFPERFM